MSLTQPPAPIPAHTGASIPAATATQRARPPCTKHQHLQQEGKFGAAVRQGQEINGVYKAASTRAAWKAEEASDQ